MIELKQFCSIYVCCLLTLWKGDKHSTAMSEDLSSICAAVTPKLLLSHTLSIFVNWVIFSLFTSKHPLTWTFLKSEFLIWWGLNLMCNVKSQLESSNCFHYYQLKAELWCWLIKCYCKDKKKLNLWRHHAAVFVYNRNHKAGSLYM